MDVKNRVLKVFAIFWNRVIDDIRIETVCNLEQQRQRPVQQLELSDPLD